MSQHDEMLARWPQYLPFPTAIPRWEGEYSVPNEQAINWPQSQFAPEYLKPGSPSFQPYRYPPGGDLKRFTPSQFSEQVSTLGPTRAAVPVQDASALGDLAGLGYDGCDCGPDCNCAPCQAKRNPSLPDWLNITNVGLAVAATVVGYAVWSKFGGSLAIGNPSAMESSIRASSKPELERYVEWTKKDIARWKKSDLTESAPGMIELRKGQLKVAQDELKKRKKK